jgi:hypothetical protein
VLRRYEKIIPHCFTNFLPDFPDHPECFFANWVSGLESSVLFSVELALFLRSN